MMRYPLMTRLAGAKEQEMLDDIRSYKELMSAVVNRAVLDSLIQPSKQQTLAPIARNAIEFLFSDDIGLYLEFLDIDAKYFKDKFINNMFDDNEDVHFSPTKKRMFRINYKRYIQEKNHDLIIASTYIG